MTNAEILAKIFNDNHLYVENLCDETSFLISFDIEWGDWKHEHLRAKYLIEQQFKHAIVRSEVTEEDGSDCYSAHYIAACLE